MTEAELLRQARVAGTQEPEALTFGELMEELELSGERERRFLQLLSLVAYRHAVLTARALAGQNLPALGEAFPFWSREELGQAKLEQCRRTMERLAARKEERDGDHTDQ